MMESKKFITKLMYGSIALAGVIAASVILFARSGDAVGNSFITVLLILLTDAFILLGLVARHEILKISLWISSIYAMIVATVYTWLPRPSNYYNLYNGYGYEKTPETEMIELFNNLTAGAYLLTIGLGILAVFSLFSNVIESNKKSLESEEKFSDLFYKLSVGIGLFTTIIFTISRSFNIDGFIIRIGFASLFIAMTAALIMAISAISSNVKVGAMKASNFINGGHGGGKIHPYGPGYSQPYMNYPQNNLQQSVKNNPESSPQINPQELQKDSPNDLTKTDLHENAEKE